MAYLWYIPKLYSDKYVGLYDHEHSPEYLLFMQGHYLKESLGLVYINLEQVKLESLKKYNCIPNSGSAPLIDKKTREILDDLCEFDIQYFDVIIGCRDGVSKDYKLVNFTQNVLAIDHENSTYSLIAGPGSGIMGFKHLKLLPNCLGGHLIARNKEYSPHILVHHKLVDSFKKNKIKGVEFITIDEFNNIRY